jgi:MYXO-CTERM domain-containing protein
LDQEGTLSLIRRGLETALTLGLSIAAVPVAGGQERPRGPVGMPAGTEARRAEELYREMLRRREAAGPRQEYEFTRPTLDQGQTLDCVSAVESECVSNAPEPSAMILVATGLLGLAAVGLVRRRRSRTAE